jgi:hypothetical protein
MRCYFKYITNNIKYLCFSKLAGKTLFITGASRGIGKAIALKAARDGANVAIAAKTVDPHPKLPGTIYTAAEESKILTWHFTSTNVGWSREYCCSFLKYKCRLVQGILLFIP